MRKFLVVMLVLAIAGGAFAEEGGGTWSAWSGSATLGTTFDFYNDGGWYVASDASAKEPGYGIFGGAAGVSLKVQWDYVNEEWSIKLPFVFDAKTSGVSGAEIAYASGNVKVSIPISFNFIITEDKTIPGSLPIEWKTAAIQATYTGENFAFTLGVKDLLGGQDADENAIKPSLGPVGGYYSFDGTADLYVSTGGAYATKWWRASDITIGAISYNGRMRDANADPARKANWFEDISAGGKNGLAFRYNLTDTLNFGFAFAGGAGDAMFTTPSSGANDFLNAFLFQPTFGVRFTDFGLDVGAMYGIRVYDDARHYKVSVGHVSAAYKFDFGLSVNGDIAFVIDPSDEQDNGGVAKPTGWYNWANSQLYYGLNIAYTLGDIKAGLRFRGLDQQRDPTNTDNRRLRYQHDMRLDLGYNAGGTGLWATAFFEITDMYRFAVNAKKKDNDTLAEWDNQFAMFNAGASVGYSGFELDAFTFGASIDLTINHPHRYYMEYRAENTSTSSYFDYSSNANNNAHIVGFAFKPTASWAVIENGTIDFAYTLGASNFARKNGIIDTSKLSITFAWKF